MRTMLGLAAPVQPVVITRAVSVVQRRDPFRGSPVGESVRARRCLVLGVQSTARLELVAQHSDANDAHNAQLECLRAERAAAIGRGDHADAARIARRIGAAL